MALERLFGRARLPQPGQGAVLAAVLIAVLARLMAIWTADLGTPTGDSLVYHQIASSYLQEGTFLQDSLAAEFGLEDSITAGAPRREPLHSVAIGYPAYLAAVYGIFGDGAGGRLAALTVLAIMTGVAVPPAALAIYRDLGGTSGTGAWVALGAAALWPEAFTMAPELLSENLALALFAPWAWLVCGMAAGRVAQSGKYLAVAGVLGGLVFLVRAEFLPIIVAGSLLAGSQNGVEPEGSGEAEYRLRPAMVVLLIALPFLAFPTVRNYRNYGEFIPLSTVGGNSFWLGALDSRAFLAQEDPMEEVRQIYVPGKPAETDRNFFGAGMEWAVRDPVNYSLRMIQRFFMMHFHAFGEPAVIGKPWYQWAGRFLLRFSRVLFVPLFLLGLWFALGRRPIVWFLFGIYVYKFLFLHVCFDAQTRMFLPIYFLVIAGAAVMLDLYFWKDTEGRREDEYIGVQAPPANC